MRDVLTAIAVALILVLLGALAVPHLVTWDQHRPFIESRLTSILGLPVKTEGPIGVTLLPAPRLTLGILLVGGNDAEDPTARLDRVVLEVALLPLMSREVRVTEARAALADITTIVRADGKVALPTPMFTTALGDGWRVAVDKIAVDGGSLRVMRAGETGSTVISPIALEAAADAISGPWRLSGQIAGTSVQMTTGENDGNGRIRLKGYVGGGEFPRVDFDGAVGETISGTIRLTFGPPVQAHDIGPGIPLVLAAKADGDWRGLDLSNVSVELGEGRVSTRLTGSGKLALSPQPRAVLTLATPLIDIDAWAVSPAGRSFENKGGRAPLTSPVEIEASIQAERVIISGEEARELAVGLTLGKVETTVTRLAAILPGEANLVFSGIGRISTDSRLEGHLSINVQAPRKLAGWLGGIGVSAPSFATFAEAPLKFAADLAATSQYVGLRNVDLSLGGGRITGAGRYSPPDSALPRGRFDAQIVAVGLDLAMLPALDGVVQRAGGVDIGFALDARDLRIGAIASGTQVRTGAGRVRARVSADATGISFDSLDIEDLAGLNAQMSGRLAHTAASTGPVAPEGANTMTGTIASKSLDPVLTLAAKLIGIETAMQLLPTGLRALPLAGQVTLTTARGTQAGGDVSAPRIDADFNGVSGATKIGMNVAYAPDEKNVHRLEKANLSLATQGGTVVPRGWPSRFVFELQPDGGNQLTLSGRADGDGVAIITRDTMLLDMAGSKSRPAIVAVQIDDMAPWLSALNLPSVPNAEVQAAALSLSINLSGESVTLRPRGKIAGVTLAATMEIDLGTGAISGEASVDNASFASLAAPVLGHPAKAEPGRMWPTARFGPEMAFPFKGQLALNILRFDLGGGIIMDEVSTRAQMSDTGLALRDVKGRLGNTSFGGALTLSRQGGRASLTSDMKFENAFTVLPAGLNALVGGQMPLSLRLGAAGESPAALIANLNGAGQGTWSNISIPSLSPAAPARTVMSAVKTNALPSLSELESQLREAFAAGPFAIADQSSVTVPVSVSAGVMKVGPVQAQSPEGQLNLHADIDLKISALNARAHVRSPASPPGWTGSPPQAGIVWQGPVSAPVQRLDATSLLNGLASIRLTQELDRIDVFEQDARERAFFSRRLRSERDRAAAEASPPAAPAPLAVPVR